MDGVIFKTYSLSDLLISQAASFEFLSSRYLSIKPAKTLSASSFDSSANAFPLTPEPLAKGALRGGFFAAGGKGGGCGRPFLA